MSEMDTPALQVSQQYQINQPAVEQACLVPEQDWAWLKKRVGRIQTGSLAFHTTGSILLGIAGSAFIAAITVPKPDDKIEGFAVTLTCWSVLGLCLISGLLALYFASQQRKERETTKDEVLEDFGRLEARYLRQLNADGISHLEGFLLSRAFILVFEPPDGEKEVQFGQGGAILKGRNENEHCWRVANNVLEFLTDTGVVFSRFHFDPRSSRFDNPGGSETGMCDHPQYMIPAP